MDTCSRLANNDIPGEQRQDYVAMAASLLAETTWRWAESGGIPPEEKQKAGEEAIGFARQSLEINIQLYGTESEDAAAGMTVLASILEFFNDNGGDEVLRLLEQAIAIGTRVEGRMSLKLGPRENNLGSAYCRRAMVAMVGNDVVRLVMNLQLALPHYRKAAEIFKANNHMDAADIVLGLIVDVEERLAKAAVVAAAAAAAARR